MSEQQGLAMDAAARGSDGRAWETEMLYFNRDAPRHTVSRRSRVASANCVSPASAAPAPKAAPRGQLKTLAPRGMSAHATSPKPATVPAFVYRTRRLHVHPRRRSQASTAATGRAARRPSVFCRRFRNFMRVYR